MSTSKNWAAVTLAICALLLSGCAAVEDMAGDFTPSGEQVPQASASPVIEPPVSTGEYDLIESCNAFFTGPLLSSITATKQYVAGPLDENLTGNVSTISKGLGLLIGKSDEVSIAHLEAVRAPFDQALEDAIARPTAVDDAIETYRATCAEAGFTG